MIRNLTPEQVLFIHDRLIQLTGGEHGLRDLSKLLSALDRPQAALDEFDLYPGVFEKGAALLDSLIRDHPFLDGNKRTAITAVGLFLQINGYLFDLDNRELVRFTLACAQSQVVFDKIVYWLRNFCNINPGQ